VYTTHGFSSVFARFLKDNGIPAEEVKTAYGDTDEELNIITEAV